MDHHYDKPEPAPSNPRERSRLPYICPEVQPLGRMSDRTLGHHSKNRDGANNKEAHG
jgi:hypothetical protein